jgi:phytoene/squalene synthetase
MHCRPTTDVAPIKIGLQSNHATFHAGAFKHAVVNRNARHLRIGSRDGPAQPAGLRVVGAGSQLRAAMDLGVAFQLTNFLRDVGEDWDRGRIYLPLEDLDRFGVGEWDFHTRQVGPAFRRLLAFQIARARRFYRRAEEGWPLLPPASQRCIRVAHRLYGGILDAIEARDYQVFRLRAAVPVSRKVVVAAREVLRPTRSARCDLA